MADFYDYKQIAEEIKAIWARRRAQMIKYWDFYNGDAQRYYLSRLEGEDEDEYLNRVLIATIENHCAKSCDVLVSYLYGQPKSENRVRVHVLDENGEIIENLQKILSQNVWYYNDIDTFRLDCALGASVTGVSTVYKEFVDKRTGIKFNKLASQEDKKKYGTVRYELLDTINTMPLPLVESSGVVHPRVVGAVVRLYDREGFSGLTVFDKSSGRVFVEDEILEVFTNDKFVRARTVGANGQPEIIEGGKNPYGRLDVVFTVFRNHGDPQYIEGQSDLEQIIPLQITLNELQTDDRSTIAYHSFPILKMLGGAKLPQNFVRKANSALELDLNQDADYLTWDNVLEASQAMSESIRKQMTVVTGVSQLSRGNAETVGQVRSGAGLKTLFQADINAVALKVPHFKKAEKELAQTTLEMYAKETGLSLPDKYFIEVEFPPDFVGMDELLKAQTEQIELTTGMRTLKELVLRRHPELNSEAELEEIIETAMEDMKKTVEVQTPKQQQPQSSTQKSAEQQT